MASAKARQLGVVRARGKEEEAALGDERAGEMGELAVAAQAGADILLRLDEGGRVGDDDVEALVFLGERSISAKASARRKAQRSATPLRLAASLASASADSERSMPMHLAGSGERGLDGEAAGKRIEIEHAAIARRARSRSGDWRAGRRTTRSSARREGRRGSGRRSRRTRWGRRPSPWRPELRRPDLRRGAPRCRCAGR